MLMKKILIVDDYAEVQELIRVTLEPKDFLLISAKDGAEALNLTWQEQPDLILLDVKLPGSRLDGLEVCYLIKNNPKTEDIKIIMLSASGQQQDIEAGFLAGADNYICKPFSPIGLMEKIEQALLKGDPN